MPEPTADDPAPSWTTLSRKMLNKVYVIQPHDQNEEPWSAKIKRNEMNSGNDIGKGGKDGNS